MIIDSLPKSPCSSLKSIGLIFALGCLLPLISVNDAYSADYKVYVKGNVGYLDAIPKAKTSYFYQAEKKLKPTYQASIGAGLVFKDKIRTDLTFSHFGDLKYKSSVPTLSGKIVDEVQKIRVNTFMLSAYYDFLHEQTVSPFVGAGVGIANIRPTNAVQTSATSTATVINRMSNTNNAAFAVSAGANVKVQKNLFLEVGYQFTYLGKLKKFSRVDTYNGSGALVSSNTIAGLKNYRLSTQTVYTGLRYVF